MVLPYRREEHKTTFEGSATTRGARNERTRSNWPGEKGGCALPGVTSFIFSFRTILAAAHKEEN